jgi:hypothetical protein
VAIARALVNEPDIAQHAQRIICFRDGLARPLTIVDHPRGAD